MDPTLVVLLLVVTAVRAAFPAEQPALLAGATELLGRLRPEAHAWA